MVSIFVSRPRVLGSLSRSSAILLFPYEEAKYSPKKVENPTHLSHHRSLSTHSFFVSTPIDDSSFLDFPESFALAGSFVTSLRRSTRLLCYLVSQTREFE